MVAESLAVVDTVEKIGLEHTMIYVLIIIAIVNLWLWYRHMNSLNTKVESLEEQASKDHSETVECLTRLSVITNRLEKCLDTLSERK